MRAVTIGILALLCGGCAAPGFDLVSRDPESPWLVGNRWVRTESSRASVNAAFESTVLDHLVFEVEVVNQSDSTLVVDPQRFSYRLSSSGNDLPRKLRRSFVAVDPDAVVARLDKAIARGADASVVVTALAGLVLVTAVALDLVEFGAGTGRVQPAELAVYDGHPQSTPEQDFRRARQGCLTRLLHRVALAPGETARGEVWLPAWPVTQAMGHPSQPNSMSITAVSPHTLPDHGLTLRTPDELGGQEIEYSVAPEW